MFNFSALSENMARDRARAAELERTVPALHTAIRTAAPLAPDVATLREMHAELHRAGVTPRVFSSPTSRLAAVIADQMADVRTETLTVHLWVVRGEQSVGALAETVAPREEARRIYAQIDRKLDWLRPGHLVGGDRAVVLFVAHGRALWADPAVFQGRYAVVNLT